MLGHFVGLTNERDFPVPSESRPGRVAACGNQVPRCRGQTFHQLTYLLEGEIMVIVTVGIDLAKNVFAVHGVDETGNPVLVRPEVPRAKLMELIASLPPCLIGM
jgi:transposase